MAAEAQELLQFITKLASRPPSPTPSFISVSRAHSNTQADLLPSAPPAVTSQAVRAKTADYRIPLKGPTALRADTLPSTSHQTQSVPSDIIREIRASNLLLHQIQQQQGEIHINLARVCNSIKNQKGNTFSYCSVFIIIVLLLITIGFIVYHIFFDTD